MKYAKTWKSYEYSHLFEDPEKSDSSSLTNHSDIVLFYHTNDWSNMLTEDNLHKACLLEQELRLKSGCENAQNASVLSAFYDANCNLLQSFEDTLDQFVTPENKYFFEDSMNSNQTTLSSRIIISYYQYCFIRSTDLDNAQKIVDRLTVSSHVKITYARNDLIKSSFERIQNTDIALDLFSCVIVLILLLVTIPCKLAVIMLFVTSFSAVLSLGIVRGTGYDHISLYSVVIFPIQLMWSSICLLCLSHFWGVELREIVDKDKNAQGRTWPARIVN